MANHSTSTLDEPCINNRTDDCILCNRTWISKLDYSGCDTGMRCPECREKCYRNVDYCYIDLSNYNQSQRTITWTDVFGSNLPDLDFDKLEKLAISIGEKCNKGLQASLAGTIITLGVNAGAHDPQLGLATLLFGAMVYFGDRNKALNAVLS